jgi:small-conductance mechanosensitive channel
MPYWERFTILAVVVGLAILLAKFVDSRIKRLNLDPAAETRYRVLRRTLMVGIVFIALLAGLLTIPEVRGVAGALLASSAVIAIVLGVAAQRTIGNFIAGLLIAFAQPIRLGDYVETEGQTGVVEEIGLTYTFIRTADNDRLVIPNEKIASDTIRNSSIRSGKKLAQVTVPVPLDRDLDAVIGLLREVAGDDDAQVRVTDLDDRAHLTLSVWVPNEPAAERVESELRLKAHTRLREAGVFA